MLVSRWITPTPLPKRFDTWFFAGMGSDAPVEVDGGEIHEHRWIAVADALAAQRAGEIELPPPTFVTLTKLAPLGCAADALASFRRGPMETFEPRLYPIDDGAVTLYAGDVGYEDGALDRPGARHRLLDQQRRLALRTQRLTAARPCGRRLSVGWRQRPVKTGWRRSAKASMPSLVSSDCVTRDCTMASSSSAVSRSDSNERLNRRFDIPIAKVGPVASR